MEFVIILILLVLNGLFANIPEENETEKGDFTTLGELTIFLIGRVPKANNLYSVIRIWTSK